MILLVAALALGVGTPLALAARDAPDKRPPVCKKGQKSTKKKPCVKPKPKPKPKPAPTPTTTAAPPPPVAENGRYNGQTSQGLELSFEVTGSAESLQITNLTFKFEPTCQPNAVVHGTGGSKDPIPIQADGTASSTLLGQGTFTVKFDATHRAASGQLQETFSFTAGGTTFQCATGALTWSATKQ